MHNQATFRGCRSTICICKRITRINIVIPTSRYQDRLTTANKLLGLKYVSFQKRISIIMYEMNFQQEKIFLANRELFSTIRFTCEVQDRSRLALAVFQTCNWRMTLPTTFMYTEIIFIHKFVPVNNVVFDEFSGRKVIF